MKPGLRQRLSRPSLGLVVCLLSALAVLTLVLATGLGPVSVSPIATLNILLSRMPGFGALLTPKV